MALNTTPIPVLLYHSVSEQSTPGFRRWTVSPERFAAHMALLQAEEYRTLTVSEAMDVRERGAALPERVVLITFDDGFQDFAQEALPILAAHDFRATLYVVTGYLGETSRWLADVREERRRMLDLRQLNHIEEAGIEIGAHGHSHAMLDLLPRDALQAEIETSRDILQTQLGHTVASFAYPHGYSNAAVRHAVHDAGFVNACAVHDALSGGLAETFEIPRIIVEHDTDEATLLNRLRGHDLPSETIRHARAGVWRVRRQMWRGHQRALASELTQ